MTTCESIISRNNRYQDKLPTFFKKQMILVTNQTV